MDPISKEVHVLGFLWSFCPSSRSRQARSLDCWIFLWSKLGLLRLARLQRRFFCVLAVMTRHSFLLMRLLWTIFPKILRWTWQWKFCQHLEGREDRSHCPLSCRFWIWLLGTQGFFLWHLWGLCDRHSRSSRQAQYPLLILCPPSMVFQARSQCIFVRLPYQPHIPYSSSIFQSPLWRSPASSCSLFGCLVHSYLDFRCICCQKLWVFSFWSFRPWLLIICLLCPWIFQSCRQDTWWVALSWPRFCLAAKIWVFP